MAKELNKDTLNLDYDAPFRIMLEKYLPQIIEKLIESDQGNICEIIFQAVEKQRRRMGK